MRHRTSGSREPSQNRRSKTGRIVPACAGSLALRVQRRQGTLFADGSTVQHFAVVTTRVGEGFALLRWHREKAGTVEHTHHILKNELARPPSPAASSGRTPRGSG